MMKRILLICAALLLALSLLTGAAAETVLLATLADGSQVTLETDIAVKLTNLANDDGVIAVYAEKEDLAPVRISIAADDLVDGLSMAELSEEEMAELIAMAGDQFTSPSTQLATTPSGNQYLCVYEEGQPVWSVFTLYHGYYIELVQANTDLDELTQEDSDFCLSLLYGIWINAAE